ncbi:MAG: Hsp20/alpha crystallin family protein [candidate division Zixibacteria bacterium]|nr:Hsp20/alpha crystallin family protein [candidate division Zixibacteria bacterium]
MRFVVNNQGSDFGNCGFEWNNPSHGREFRRENPNFPVNMELIEGKDAFTIIAELPGMSKEDIKINIENEVLTITGERKQDKNDNENILWSERFFGRFRRDYRVGNRVDNGNIRARFNNGLLTITLPLKEEVKPKSIEVAVN